MVTCAVQFLKHLLASDLPYIHRIKLQANEGILSNNILHGRDKFENGVSSGTQRLMYRARYYDRIAGTSINDH
ncbi:MAG TPA: taurine catabolism dioxygenase TauD, partial [Gammaproteobacteria bacterium]